MSIEPFKRLVELTARAFYDDITMKADNQPKNGRRDNRGIVVVVLDALTRRQWVREEDLAKDLKLSSKLLRRPLRFLEEEKLIRRDHRKEFAKIHNAAADGQRIGREGDEKIKRCTHSYCCLDYEQIYDVVSYRTHRMRKKLKDELDNKKTVLEYICSNCRKRYNALDALWLATMDVDDFHCEVCNGVLDQVDGGRYNARRCRDKLEVLLKKMEAQLQPLMEQLNRLKDLPIPKFGALQGWEARASAAARAANGLGFGGGSMLFVGETVVEVAFSSVEEKEDKTKSESANVPMKVLPPWMIKQGMNLTKEQRVEVKEEAKTDGSRAPVGASDEKSSNEKDDEKNIQDEYVKAYYATLLQRQRDQEAAAKRDWQQKRQVGMKSKRKDEDDGDDIEWEEGSFNLNIIV